MKKRAFLKLLSGMTVWPVTSPLEARAPVDKITNWAGNLEYGTDRLHSAASVEQVRQFVRSEKALKTLGSRHCFNDIADSTQAFLSLRPMQVNPPYQNLNITGGAAKVHRILAAAVVRVVTGDIGRVLLVQLARLEATLGLVRGEVAGGAGHAAARRNSSTHALRGCMRRANRGNGTPDADHPRDHLIVG